MDGLPQPEIRQRLHSQVAWFVGAMQAQGYQRADIAVALGCEGVSMMNLLLGHHETMELLSCGDDPRDFTEESIEDDQEDA